MLKHSLGGPKIHRQVSNLLATPFNANIEDQRNLNSQNMWKTITKGGKIPPPTIFYKEDVFYIQDALPMWIPHLLLLLAMGEYICLLVQRSWSFECLEGSKDGASTASLPSRPKAHVTKDG